MNDRERDEMARVLAGARAANGGRIPYGMAKQAAEALGYSTKTAQRDARRGSYERLPRRQHAPEPLSQHERDMIALAHGNHAAAHRRLPKETRASYATFMRRAAADPDLSPATRADMASGDRARREHELKLLRVYEYPFQVLVFDEKELSIEVRHPHTGDPVSPIVGHARDGFSGAIAGAAATPEEGFDHNDHLRTLGDALDENSDILAYGGMPSAVQWDQSTAHTADKVTLALCDLHVPAVVIDGYHPHLDGIIEGFYNFVELDYCRPHPFYLHGRKTLDGKPIRPSYEALPSWEEFWADYRRWLRWYNHEWKQRLRGNKTPIELLDGADRHPDPVDPAMIASLLSR